MRYEDASGAFQASGPIANDDADTLSAGERGPATGNLITGEGTQYGSAGADIAAGAKITAIAGKGGEDTSLAAGKLSVEGEHGRLTVDADGNYSYMANANVENVRDRFTYTLADNAGNSDTAALIVEIGKTPAVIKANAQQIVPGPDGVVTLPPGVELSDVRVVGRNLVVDLPDGTQLIIIDGAIFVPQLVLGGVEVPATNVAALLIGQEVQPAAGEIPPSGGGNFALPPPPLDPGIPLGDLIPPTELTYVPPEPQEVFPEEDDEEPEIFVQPDGQPAAIAAVDQVEEAGLPTRNGNLPGEPAGSGESADGNGADNDVTSETTTGNIVYDSPDGVDSITLNGVVITTVGQVIPGAFGDLTITSIAPGVIGYSYTLDDNTSGNDTHDDFQVILTDSDGDQASATLRIDIIDDVPTARPDTDLVPSGQYGPVTGNVITDASAGDAGDGDAGADTVGADNATVTAVSSANVPANSDSSAPFSVNGQYGVLTLQSDGSYSYVRNPGTPGGVNDVFNYTLTDGDGDTSSTTLTISIGDATPQTAPNPLAQLDDDALPGGIPGGVGDDPDAANLSGNLQGIGGDGPLTFDLLLTGAPAGFSYVDGPNGAVHVMQGGTHVLTITINAATGAYTISQVNPIDHAAGGDENNVQFTINYQVRDQDGDTADGTLNIDVDDDTPEMNRADVSLPTLTVDETDLTTNASADYSVVFDGDFGADGPGTLSYAVSVVNGTDSGLVDVATGDPILLFMNGSVVEGRVGGAGGAVAFTVSVNSGTGVVTLDQIRALEHPLNPNNDEPVSAIADSIQLTASITDGDGDSDSLTVNIGHTLVFEDDGPTVNPTLNAQVTVTVDESLPSNDPGINTGGIAKGDDPHLAGGIAIGQSSSGSAIVNANAVFGADGPAAGGGISYALVLGANDTTLTLTDGSTISLQLVGGVVVGVVDNGPFAGQAAFALAIDPATGVVTVEQYLSLDHPVNPDPNDPLGLGPNSVGVTVTATDGDGDPVTSGAVDISNQITFLDDGPTVNPTLSTAGPAIVDESEPVNVAAIDTGGITKADDPHLGGGLAIGLGSTGGAVLNANAVFGADGPAAAGSLSYDLVILNASSGLTTTEGNPINLVELPSGVIVGVVSGGPFNGQAAFAISINSTTGVVTVEQYLSLDHPIFPDNFDEAVFLNENVLGATVTATDGDGDPVTSPAVDIGSKIQFEDDGPSATDEPQQNVQEGNQTVSGTFDFVGGADGASVTHLNDIALVFAGDGWSQWIPVDDGQIRAQADGDYQFQSDASGSGVTSGTFTVTDGDGDQVEADWAFNITDANAPTAGISAARLDDDGLAGGNPLSTTNDIDANVGERPGEGNPEEDIFNGQLTLNFGGDGPGTVTFAAMHNLTGSVGTETVRYTWAGSTLTATVEGGPRNGTVLFDIVVDQATGEYTLTLRDNVIHTAGGDETSAPNVALTYTVTDSDNSPAGGVNGTLNITFNDDAPTVTNVQAGAGVDVDETDAGTPAGFPISDTSAGAVITATSAFGADGAAAANATVYGLAITGGPASGLFTAVGNFAITLVQIDGDTIQGHYNGSNVAFTIQMNANGTVTLTQNVPLEHNTDSGPAPTGHNDTLDLTGLINATITITDGDGDTATGSAPIGDNLVFFDDGPDAQVDGQAALDQLVLDETRPLGTETDGDSNPAGLGTVTANFANNFVGPVDYGADGAGTTTYSLFLSANGIGSGLFALDPTDTETVVDGFGKGAEIQLSINPAGTLITGAVGGTTYFTISIDPATGEVTFTQLANIWHANTANDDDTSTLMTAAASNVQVVQRVTDSDGDFDTASVNIGQGVFHIEDDGPEFTAVQAVLNIANDSDPAGTGNLDFDLGTDGPSANNNVISVSNFAVKVNGIALDPSDFSLTPGAETATTASYTFSFSYDTGSGGTATANGTLVFDKVNGSYTVDLDGPIEGFSILQTATGTLFQGYEFGTSTPDGSQPAISVTQIQGTPGDPQPDDLFLQFTSVSEPSSGTGDNNLEFSSWVPGADNPAPVNGGGDTSFNAGDLFNQTDGWVSTSNTANGVDGDTIQGSEVLDFTLVQGANPTGVLADESTYGQASAMFLKFDGIGAQEDIIVVLKLYDPNTDTYTTRAIMVQNADIQKGPGNGPGDYAGVSLDNNDGLVIIESNDYNGAGENWVIVGAQIAGSDQGLTGSAINLNSAIGDAGGSNTTGSFQAFSTDTHDGPFKISSIGFVTEQSTDQSATLDFDVTITEADGDSETQHLTVNVGDPPPAPMEPLSTKSGSTQAANDDYSSLFASDVGGKAFANSFGNVGTTGITSAMVAASGLAAMSMTSLNSFDQKSAGSLVQDSYQLSSAKTVVHDSLDQGVASISLGSEHGGSAFNAVNLSSSGFSFGDRGFGGGSLDAMSFGGGEPAYVPNFASGEPMVANVPAFAANVPTVSMASAEMLRAAALDGDARQGGAIEQVLADALGEQAPTIDALLANLPGGIGELAAIANLASPGGAGVPAWDMGMQGGFAPMHDMVMKVAAVALHQDAVQPA